MARLPIQTVTFQTPMRNPLLVFHRWLALVTSIFIVIVAMTGSALVFEGAIDRGLNPQLWHVAAASRIVSLDTLAARARAAVSQQAVAGLSFAREPDRAFVAQAGPIQVFLDPYTGAVLGTRTNDEYNASLPRRLHVLHTSFMAHGAGSAVVAIVTLASLLLTITGIALWWRDRLWRVRWIASWKRIVFDLHHALGVVASLTLFIITSSGLTIHYNAIGKTIAALDATPHAAPPTQPASPVGGAGLALDSVASVAQAALRGASITFLSFPAAAKQPFVVAMRYPEDRTPGGRSRVYIDRYRGTTLAVEGTRTAQAGTAINNLMRSLHTGDIFGKPTEVIWLFAALVLASQAVSGFLMWWNGRAARAALARRIPR